MTSNQRFRRLVALQRAEFAKAATRDTVTQWLQNILAVIGVVTIFLENDAATYVAAGLGALISILLAVVDYLTRQSRVHAEYARRTTLTAGGLGVELSRGDYMAIESLLTADSKTASKYEDDNYYDTSNAIGPARLADMLEESAFWSCYLTRHSFHRTLVRFGILLLLGAIILGAAIFFTPDHSQSAAKIFFAVLSFAVSAQIAGAAGSYYLALQILEKIVPRIERVRAEGLSIPQLLMVVGDYNSAVESAPLFVSGLYKRHKGHLNELWKAHQSKRD